MLDFETYWFAYLVGAIINGVLWGVVCKYIISIKEYDESKQKSYFWVGFFLGIIGVIIAVANPQNTSPAKKSTSSNKDDKTWKCSYCGRVNYSRFKECACGKTRTESKLRSEHVTWKCSYCGWVNLDMSNECRCGKTRSESEYHRRNPSVSPVSTTDNKSSKTTEDNTLNNMEAIKKLKELLDMGAITQEEFDTKKAKLLR